MTDDDLRTLDRQCADLQAEARAARNPAELAIAHANLSIAVEAYRVAVLDHGLLPEDGGG